MALDDALRDDPHALSDDLVELRRRPHRHPQIGLDLPVTRDAVLAALDGLGVEEQRYQPMDFPRAGAEDFSRVLGEVPGCYLRFGASVTDDLQKAPGNHSPRAAFSNAVLADGALVHAQLVIRAPARDVAGYAATAGTGVAR